MVVVCTSCVELFEFGMTEDLSKDFVQGFTVEQCLLWVTCTGHHWLIALWITIGATY